MKKVISTDKAPLDIGPYSQAVMVGNMLFLSGQLPINPVTGKFISSDIKEQTKQSLTNAKTILEEAGYTMKDVVKTSVFLSDINNFAEMNEVYIDFFKEDYPARSAFEVNRLPLGVLVEIECIACKG